MKSIPVFSVSLVFILSSPLLRADAGFKRDLAELQDQRAKALAAAAEPINRRYEAALEQLLFRANQAKDAESAARIQAEIAGLKTAAVTHSDLHAALDDSDWTWERPGASPTMHFSKDGTLQHPGFAATWEPAGGRIVRIKAAWGECTLTFNDTFTEYRATSGEPAKQGVKGKKK